MDCRQAIIEGGKIIGWKDYNPSPNKLTTSQWLETKESKLAKKTTLKKARDISRNTGEKFHLEITKRRPYRWFIKWHLPIGSRLIGRSA